MEMHSVKKCPARYAVQLAMHPCYRVFIKNLWKFFFKLSKNDGFLTLSLSRIDPKNGF